MEINLNNLRRFSSIAAVAMLGVLGSLDTARAQAIVANPAQVSVNATSSGNSGESTFMLSVTSSFSTFSIASSSTCNCLATNPSMGTVTSTPQSILVIVNPTGVGAGNYTGTLTITGPSVTNSPQTVQVTITISPSGNSTIQVFPSPLPTFTFASGSSTTSTQGLTVFSSNGSTSFTDFFSQTGGPISATFVNLDVTSGVAAQSATINVTANPAGLPDGTYTGIVTVTPTNVAQAQVQVSVTVVIGSIANVTANPPSLSYNATAGAATQSTPVSITNSTASAVTLTPSVFTNTCGSGWLAETPTTAFTIQPSMMATVNVTINPASLSNGTTCQGSVTLTPGAGSGLLTIPVTVNVGSGGTGSLGLAAFPTSITISAPVGVTKTGASLQITTTSSSAGIATSVTPLGSWLSVSPSFVGSFSSSSPANLTVFGDPTNLVAGTYNGTVTITGQAFNGGTLMVPVTFTVGGSGGSAPFAVAPTSLGFTIPSGSSTPVSQTLQVTTGSVNNVGVTATTSTDNASGNWLTVNPPNLQQVNSTTPLNYSVSVSPAAFVGSGPFTGNVILTPLNGSSAVLVPISVTVGNATLKVTPSQLNFAWQTTTAFPAPQSVSVTSQGGAVAISSQATTTSGGNWLIINPTSGVTGSNGSPATITVSVNPSGLTAGNTYSGNIAITGGASTVNVGVSLLVSNQPILALSSSQNTFNYQLSSSTLPPAQTVQVTSSGNQVSFSASVDTSGTGGNFLTVTPPSGTTPQPLSLTLNATQLALLAPGTYTTTVTLTAVGAGNTPVSFMVTLIVGNNNLLNASQGSLSFNYQTGGSAPPTQALNISSSGQPLVYSATATSTNCGNFLSVSPATGTTPSSVGVTVSVSGVVIGTCTGVVHIASTSNNVGNSPLDIPVTLYVSNGALLNVSPSAINVTTTVGTNPLPQTVGLTSTDGTTLSFSVTSQTNDGISWLLVGPTGGSTPSNLNIGFNAAGLPAKTYTGSITIASTGPANAPVVIPVTLNVTSSITAAVTPASLTFTQPFAGLAPASQTLQITSSSTVLTFSPSVTTFNGGNWLTASGNATTPGSVTVSANGAGLNQGTYNGFVTIAIPGAANNPLQVQVTLVVGPSQTLVLGASSLAFSYIAGSSNTPAAQTVSVTSSGGSVPFTVTSTGNFIAVTPASGTTPGSLSISLVQSVLATLAPGPYTGTVTIASPGLPSQTITINLTVAPQPAPVIGAVVNAASMLAGPLSPGEIITIFGSNIGPASSLTYQTTAGGLVSTTLGNTMVTFDNNFPAPLLFVSAGQINAIVPYELNGRFSTSVVVTRNGVASAPLVFRMADTAPAIFSLTQSGSGQGAILNQNSSVNGAANPEAKGRVIAIYATGEGVLTPQPATGSFTGLTPPFPKPTAVPVSVSIGGQPATITYAGEAPTLVSGVLQVNCIVPTSIVGSGPFTVLLTVGANTSTQLITVAVQ